MSDLLRSLPQLTEQQFKNWEQLLERRTGLQLLPHLRSHVQVQLGQRMREIGCSDYDHYYAQVTDGVAGALEWGTLLDRLMVKETCFFRHPPSFRLVQQELLQRLQAENLAEAFDVWSVGCSTGEEAYSLAMTVSDCFEYCGVTPYYSVTGSDVCAAALLRARQGIYLGKGIQGIKPDQHTRFLLPYSEYQYQVVERIRTRVCFCTCNVLTMEGAPPALMDVIYCQNMLIYFRRWRRKQILDSLVARLKPAGLLVVGPGEVTGWQHPRMERVAFNGVQAYRAKV